MSEEPKPESNSPSGASQTVDPQSVEGIFLEALAKESGLKRSEFLDAACAGNTELRTRVEALLRAYHDAGSFLQQPAGDWRNPPVTAAAGSSAEVDARGIPAGLLKASDDPNALGIIGPYQVRELIGRGGMGIVFRAFDAKLNRVVAIKVLAPELAAQPTARRRFLREAQAAAAVTHPHVVTIHAVDEDEWPYLVMECIEGQSLEEKIERSGTLKLAEVLRIGTQMAEGLAAAHKQGLVHRDVKPANILLENGVERVKITDFGLARAADDVTITRPGEISGTPQYMSPEQASGQRVDQRSDLFSLGCVLYAMCAGQPPFRANSMAAIVKKICTDSPQPLREIDQQIPDWLAAVIDRLLAKDPNERIQTADEVAKLLGDALARVQAGQVLPAAVALRAAKPPSAEAESALPAWLTVVFSGVAGYWFGRLVPMPMRGEGWWFMAAGVVPALWMYSQVRRRRAMSSTLSAIFIVVGIAAFFTASGIGHDQLFRHRLRFDLADFLATGLTLMLISAAALAWRNRRSWWLPVIQEMRAAPRSGSVTPAPSGPAGLPSLSAQAHQEGLDARRNAGSLTSQPWKLAGWLVVALLALVILVPVLGTIAVLVPEYQAHQAGRDARAWQATASHLTMTFDEDLPIVDIQIDGASNGPIDISPIERLVSAGQHTITVVYAHSHRKRSVRKRIGLGAGGDVMLDLTPLVVGDMQERDRHKRVTSAEANAALRAPVLQVFHKFGAKDEPISAAAKWVDNELEVTAMEAGTTRLFELPLNRIDESIITYRFRIKTDDLASNVYSEMWTRVAGLGELFSRGFDQKIHGTTNWATVEVPALLQKDQFADLVKLNLVFEGPGKVRVKDIQVLATPSGEKTATQAAAKEDASAMPPNDKDADVEWGRAARQVQLGWHIEPKKETYRPGELITVSLFLRNVGEEPIASTMPRTQILEKLGLAIDLRNAENRELPWRWGRAHKDGQEISGGFGETFAPKVPYALPAFIVAIGQFPAQVTPGISETIMVELVPDVAPGVTIDKLPHQPLRLTFKLSSFGYELGNEADLESEAFQFRVAALP